MIALQSWQTSAAVDEKSTRLVYLLVAASLREYVEYIAEAMTPLGLYSVGFGSSGSVCGVARVSLLRVVDGAVRSCRVVCGFVGFFIEAVGLGLGWIGCIIPGSL